LTPQFFARKPLDLLFRAGMSAEMFNRFTLGRTLDEAYTYGCDLRCNHLDTTSVSLSDEYVPERDA